MPHATDDRDRRLADLVDGLADRLNSGETVDIDAVVSVHPELSTELRGLWEMVIVAHAVGNSSTLPGPENGNSALPDNLQAELVLPKQLGDYRLVEEIGRGGMGIVYRAHQESLDREVAVKLILSGELAGEEQERRFQAEAEAAARLKHPHLVPIFEVGRHDGHLFFSMALVEGETLAAQLTRGPLPARTAADIMLKVTRAIAYAHHSGVVHRDLKPANILIDLNGQPFVTDFGLAKRLAERSNLTRTGAVLGTPAYMAPEQASGSRGTVGPAADVYSLGTILYALLTGRPPFTGPSPVDTLLMLLDEEPLPPRLLNRNVDRDLEMVALRALQKPPDLRYPSADALADDLEAYLEGEPIVARSGQFSHVLARLFRETHHATVLENWGLLWMWHALVLLTICLVTNWLFVQRAEWPTMHSPLAYLVVWGGALSVWAPTVWWLRHRAGPVTAVERQIAHLWGASIAAVMLLFVVEYTLGLPVLTLSPVLGLISGMVFLVKAGVLAGAFYFHAAVLFSTAIGMAWLAQHGWSYGISLYGLISAATFFLPGWKYYRQGQSECASAYRDQSPTGDDDDCPDSNARSSRTLSDDRSEPGPQNHAAGRQAGPSSAENAG